MAIEPIWFKSAVLSAFSLLAVNTAYYAGLVSSLPEPIRVFAGTDYYFANVVVLILAVLVAVLNLRLLMVMSKMIFSVAEYSLASAQRGKNDPNKRAEKQVATLSWKQGVPTEVRFFIFAVLGLVFFTAFFVEFLGPNSTIYFLTVLIIFVFMAVASLAVIEFSTLEKMNKFDLDLSFRQIIGLIFVDKKIWRFRSATSIITLFVLALAFFLGDARTKKLLSDDPVEVQISSHVTVGQSGIRTANKGTSGPRYVLISSNETGAIFFESRESTFLLFFPPVRGEFVFVPLDSLEQVSVDAK